MEKDIFVDSYLLLMERFFSVHKNLLTMFSIELGYKNIVDISPSNAYLLLRMNRCSLPITISRFKKSKFYLITLYKNLSYSMDKLLTAGYINQTIGKDKREVHMSLTEKGESLIKMLENLLEDNRKDLPFLSKEDYKTLSNLKPFIK